MSVAGLGVDIVEIDRMERALAKSPNIRTRAFTLDEQEYCNSKSRPEVHYAMRFAAKEAVMKALGTGFEGMRLTDVEVALDDKGRPYPVLRGHACEVMEERGIVEVHLSLSFTKNTAVASAMAITEAHRPTPKEEKPDQMAELANSFKEMRSMLDTIEDDGTEDGEAPSDLAEEGVVGSVSEQVVQGVEDTSSSADPTDEEVVEPNTGTNTGTGESERELSEFSQIERESEGSPLEEELGGIDVFENGSHT